MFVVRLAPLRRCLQGIKAMSSRLIENISDPYRPELHYMRGPGPKWHARHGAVLAMQPIKTAA
jgi:hypothetical protein